MACRLNGTKQLSEPMQIGPDNGLASKRWKVIIWTNAGVYESSGLNELNNLRTGPGFHYNKAPLIYIHIAYIQILPQSPAPTNMGPTLVQAGDCQSNAYALVNWDKMLIAYFHRIRDKGEWQQDSAICLSLF